MYNAELKRKNGDPDREPLKILFEAQMDKGQDHCFDPIPAD